MLYILHQVSERKKWTHHYMLSLHKRVIYRYFNYIRQDAIDEREAIEKQREEEEREAAREKARQEREERLRMEGKIS